MRAIAIDMKMHSCFCTVLLLSLLCFARCFDCRIRCRISLPVQPISMHIKQIIIIVGLEKSIRIVSEHAKPPKKVFPSECSSCFMIGHYVCIINYRINEPGPLHCLEICEHATDANGTQTTPEDGMKKESVWR